MSREGVPLRYLAEINPPTPELARLGLDEEISHLPLSAVWPDGELDVSRQVRLRDAGASQTVVREGDIIFPKVTPSFEHNRVAVARGLANGLAVASTEIHVVRPLMSELTDLLQYRLRAADFQTQGRAEMLGVAGLRRVPGRVVGELRVSTESIEHREKIVAFLDKRLARLGLLRQRLADLVPLARETRMALIEEAFGSSAPGPRVPLWSAVDEARPIMYGIVLPGAHVPTGVPLIKAGDVQRGHLSVDELDRTDAAIDKKHVRSRLQKGDVLLTIRGHVGDSAVVPPELEGANITQDTARIAPRRGVSASWLRLVLQAPSVQQRLVALTVGASIKGINIRDLKKVQVPMPPIDDQNGMVRAVEPRLQRLNRLIERAARMQELAVVYRDSLITERILKSDVEQTGNRPAKGSDEPVLEPALLVT
ncbi:MAG: hypothetical protein ACLGG5_09170 [Thermoleophilia bacterium]